VQQTGKYTLVDNTHVFLTPTQQNVILLVSILHNLHNETHNEHVRLKTAERVGYTQVSSTGLASTDFIHSFITFVVCSCARRNTVPYTSEFTD